jgi:hypothetical protein
MLSTPNSRVFRILRLGALLSLVMAMFAASASAQSFSSNVNYSVGENPNSGVAGDFNGDTKPDLAVANVLNHNLTILINNGAGTFTSTGTIPVDHNPERVRTADLNGDGKLDLAVGNFFGGSLSTGNVSILLGNGDGTFQSAVNFNVGTPEDLVIVDVNGDTKLDLVVASNNSSKASVLLGNGDGTFQTAVSYSLPGEARGVAVADFNGDTKPDLALTNGLLNGNTSILLGNGDGTFQSATSTATGSAPTGIIAKDINGDGKQDLVVAVTASHVMGVFLGVGNGTFQSQVSYPVGQEPTQLVLDDFNGDGPADIITVNASGNSYSVLRGNADGTFQAAVTSPARTSSWAPFSGDFNTDGKPDLAILNNVFDLVDVYLNSPSGTGKNFSVTETVAATPLIATFIDFDSAKTAGSFTANINWGDGTATSAGTITANGGAFDITGTHTYAAAGVFNVTIQIADSSGNFESATSTATVKALTSTAVGTSVTPSDFGESVTFTATVTSSAGTPTGSVQFKDGGVNIGSPVGLNGSGVATVSTSTLAVGDHVITAGYSGSATFETSSGTLAGGQTVRPLPTISILNEVISEPDTGIPTLNVSVLLSAPSHLTVTVDFATADGSASAGTDYEATSGTLTFEPGLTGKAITIKIVGDVTNEFDESFFVNLSNPTNAAIVDAQGVVTITNNDTPVLLIDENSGRAVALDSVILTRDPFSLLNPFNLGGADQRRRISLFVWHLGLLPGDTAANLTVTAEDSVGGVYNLQVEHVSQLTDLNDVTQIIVRLPDNVAGAPRDLSVKVQLHGPATNSAFIKIAGP